MTQLRVLAAMSGGVDSAVAAARAADAGHQVTGVHLALSSNPSSYRTGARGCCTLEDARDARRAADVIGIPFYVWDMAERFDRDVVSDFVAEYAAGRTPNPCLRCNEKIKFAAVLDRAVALGFDAVCTGHHARLGHAPDGTRWLRRSVDQAKDQSYVLAVLTGGQLARAMFPLGGSTKDQVRQEAAARGLAVADKPDSHDVCFIADGDTRKFLAGRLGAAPGPIVDTAGQEVGRHDGAYGFTIGQRKGLRIGRPAPDGKPRYVLDIEPVSGTVTVGPPELLDVHEITATAPVWTGCPPFTTPRDCLAQLRAHGEVHPATAHLGNGSLTIRLHTPARGVAPGQAAVLYDADRVLASATITSATPVTSATVVTRLRSGSSGRSASPIARLDRGANLGCMPSDATWPRGGQLAQPGRVAEAGPLIRAGRVAEAGPLDWAGGTVPAADGAGGAGGGLWVQVLGPVLARRGGQSLELGSARQRAVLALLALQREAPVPREAIVDAVWPDGPPATAVNMVQACVGRLRRILAANGASQGRAVLTWSGESYRLRLTAGELDLLAFDELAARAAAAAPTDPAAACAFYEQALGLWHGDPAAGTGELRAHPAVTGLVLRRSSLVVEYAKVACPRGWHDRVLSQLRALAIQEPLNEPAHAWLMIALAGSGQQAAALEVFHDCRRLLGRQLGIPPGAELSRAHSLVLRQEVPPAGTPPAGILPAPLQPSGGWPSGGQAHNGQAHDGQAHNGQTHDGQTHDGQTHDGQAHDGRPAGDGPGDGPVVPRQLPPEMTNFVGRSDELAALARLQAQRDGGHVNGGPPAICAIGGSAGIGKTALAVHFAHECAREFPDGQLYVDLRGFGPAGPPIAPEEALHGFLDALNVPPGRVPEGLDERAALYRSLLAGKRVLVLLDNARDEAQVRPLLPGDSSCLTLVTSRQRLAGLAATPGASLVELDVPTDAESADMLSARLGEDRVAAEPGAAADLITLCARLPLGLVVAAARAAGRPDFPLTAVVEELRDASRRLDVLDTGDPASSVRAVFDWSYQNLSDPAARMFRLLGLHPGPDISLAAAASLAGLPLARAAALLDELTRAHLASEHAPGRFAFHDLLRAYAAEQARQTDTEAERRGAVHRVLDHYLHTAVAGESLLSPGRYQPPLPAAQPGSAPEALLDDHQAFAWFAAEHEVLKGAIAQATRAGFDRHAWQLPRALMPYLDRRGYWHEWADSSRAALAVTKRIGAQAAQAMIHNQLGRVYGLLGSHDTANAHQCEALALWERLGDKAGQAYAHHGIGHIQSHQGQLAGAIEHEREALRLYIELGDRYGQANSLNDLGWYYTDLGDTTEAIGWARKAIDLNTELGNPFGQAQSLDTLGHAHQARGEYAAAVACYRRALATCQELDSYYQAVILTHLGDALQAGGDSGAAREAWRRALLILEQLRHADAADVRVKFESLVVPAG